LKNGFFLSCCEDFGFTSSDFFHRKKKLVGLVLRKFLAKFGVFLFLFFFKNNLFSYFLSFFSKKTAFF